MTRSKKATSSPPAARTSRTDCHTAGRHATLRGMLSAPALLAIRHTEDEAEATDLRSSLESLHEASFAWAMCCCRFVRSEAEDTLQLAYMKVLEGRARFGGRSSFRT